MVLFSSVPWGRGLATPAGCTEAGARPWVSLSSSVPRPTASRLGRPEARSVLGLAELRSLGASVGDRDLLVPRSGEGNVARAVRELAM